MTDGRFPEDQAQAWYGESIRPAILGFFDFESGPVRLWGPGVGPLQWGGYEWTGCGVLMHIEELEESSDGRAITTVLKLSPIPLTVEVDGVDIDILKIAHQENWHQRRARLYAGQFELDSLRWRLEPKQTRSGFMDVMELTESGQSAQISLTVERSDFDNERPEVMRYTPAAQRARFPGDAFCDQIPMNQDRPVNWNLA